MTDTFAFAPEIERNVVSILWHEPKRLAALLAHFDPSVHLTQPSLRFILEAIQIAYAELGASDWGSVIEVLRELNRLEDVGGLDGANAVYGYDSLPHGYPIAFDHYVGLLKEYARARSEGVPAYPLTTGKGTLELNKAKRNDQACDYQGKMRVAGKLYTARAWVAPSAQFINLTFSPEL